MISFTFACGHRAEYSDQMQVSPRCSCGEIQIISVTPSRPPRFVGTVSGPYAEFKPLEPGVVDVTTAGPLKVKEQ